MLTRFPLSLLYATIPITYTTACWFQFRFRTSRILAHGLRRFRWIIFRFLSFLRTLGTPGLDALLVCRLYIHPGSMILIHCTCIGHVVDVDSDLTATSHCHAYVPVEISHYNFIFSNNRLNIATSRHEIKILCLPCY